MISAVDDVTAWCLLAFVVSVAKARRNSYCLATNVHGRAWSISGPSKVDVEFHGTQLRQGEKIGGPRLVRLDPCRVQRAQRDQAVAAHLRQVTRDAAVVTDQPALVGLGIGKYSEESGVYARDFAEQRGWPLLEIDLREQDVVITTAAVALAISTTRDTTTMTLGDRALTIAETGAENAILRLLRDPSYTGDTLPIDGGTATITVPPGAYPKVITSTGTRGGYSRIIQATLTNSGGQILVSTWEEL